MYPPLCVCTPWAHASHLVFRLHCHVLLSVFGSAALELIYLFPWFPPSLPCALSYFQDLKVIHPNQGGLCCAISLSAHIFLAFCLRCVLSVCVMVVFSHGLYPVMLHVPQPLASCQGFGFAWFGPTESQRHVHAGKHVAATVFCVVNGVHPENTFLRPESAQFMWKYNRLCQSVSVAPVDLPQSLSVFQPVCPFSCKIMTHT